MNIIINIKEHKLLRFNNGLAEYRYNLNPLMVSQESYENNKNYTSYNFKDMNKKIYNDLFNSKETNFENSNNINEINKLRKNNIKNEKIILEREKQIEGLLNKNEELEKIINNLRNEQKKIKMNKMLKN